MTSPIAPEGQTSFGEIVKRLLGGLGAHLDASPGSIVRTLAETFAREMATFYEMLELSHRAGYLDTAQGGALDNVVALLGLERAGGGRLVGSVEFSRTTPAPSDIGIPGGLQITGADPNAAIPVFETSADAVLRRGETHVAVAIHEILDSTTENRPSVVENGVLTLMIRPLLGIDAVTNPLPLSRTGEQESDDALRSRARVHLRKGEQGTSEAIAAAVCKTGVRQVTVREPEAGPPGIVEVIVGDRDFGPENAPRVWAAIRESKAAGVRARLLYAKTVYFRPKIAIEPTDPNLDDAGFDRLRRAVQAELVGFAAQLPVGETICRRRLEALLFGLSGVRNISAIEMATFARDREGAGELTPETRDRRLGGQQDWSLDPLETAVLDPAVTPFEITRVRPRTFRLSLVVEIGAQDPRATDEVRQAVSGGLTAYAGWLDKAQSQSLVWSEFQSKLAASAHILQLDELVVADPEGRSTTLRLDSTPLPLGANARLELNDVEVVRRK